MLTARGWWLFFIALVQACLGLLLLARGGMALAFLGVAALAFLFTEWIRFRFRVAFVLPRLRLAREFDAAGRRVVSSFPGQKLNVRIAIENPTRWNLPLLLVRDLVPAGANAGAGAYGDWFRIPARESAAVDYDIQPERIGILRFPGIALRLADPQGFFTHRTALRDERELPILPAGLRRQKQPRVTKRLNALPSAGAQRYLRPGGAGDLLDLRDYLSGDPPKLIAWKQSARRDRLIVKELESEVPLRCTLFLDATADAVDSPGPNSPRQVFAQTAAAVAESLLNNRDYVGLYGFDEVGCSGLVPARTVRQRVEILRKLAEIASPPTASDDMDWMIRQGHATAVEIYPDLMDRLVNRTPFGMFWEPLLDSPFARLALVFLIAPMILLWPDCREFLELVAQAYSIQDFPSFVASIALGSLALGLAIWLAVGLSGHWPTRRNRTLRRKQLAALFVALDRRPARDISRFREDDAIFAARCRAFLNDHRLAWLGQFSNPELRIPTSDRRSGIGPLADALLKRLGPARDNELFVLFGNFSEGEEAWERLLRAVQIVRSRHHEVVIICQRYPAEAMYSTATSLQRDLEAELARYYNSRLDRFQNRVRRMGVELLWADRGDTPARIVRRMADLRAARIRI